MSEPDLVVYIDHSEVRKGKLEELKAAINELAELVKAKEDRIVAYNAYFTEDGKRMTVIHIHPDFASLEYHMRWRGLHLPGSRTLSGCSRSMSTAR